MEKWRGVLYSAARLKGLLQFFRNGYGQAEIAHPCKVFLYLGGKMVDVHHKGIAALGRQFLYHAPEHRHSCNRHQGLGHVVCDGPESCPQAGGKN